MLIRPATSEDGPAVLAFMEATGFFRPCEISIADEVFTEAAAGGSDYHSYVADLNGRPVGWVCFGATPCTLGTWDIYWIGVDKTVQRQRIGTRLIRFAEAEIQKAGGRLAVIETSGSDFYEPTRTFYLKNGYKLAAAVEDFYAPGDPKLIFTKALCALSGQ